MINSQTLCTQLWNHAVVDIDKKKIRACCKTPAIQLTDDDIVNFKQDAFLNLPQLKEFRAEMLNGGKPAACQTCWNLEEKGTFSFRSGPEAWHEYFKDLNYDDYTLSYHPNDLDIQLDNYCDLKCLYCNEEFSSQWQSEKQKFGDIIPVIPIQTNYDDFIKSFFLWFNSVKDNFKRIAFLGGEPLISPRFYHLLDEVLAAYNGKFPEDLVINIITNLNTTPKYLEKFINTINHYKDKVKFNINISQEAWGTQAETIRHGLDFDRFIFNFNELAKIDGIVLSTITTVNVLSLSTLHKYLKFITEIESTYNIHIIIYPNLVSFPAHLKIDLMEKHIGTEYVDQAISVLAEKNHHGYVNFLNTLYDKFIFEEIKDADIHITLLKELETLSVRRNVNYKEIFNEYKYLWA
jgi:sulfatase maturation enzyme AslB (radical SAM superfamily)